MANQPSTGSFLRRNLIALAFSVGIATLLWGTFLFEDATNIHFLTNIESKLVDLRFLIRKERPPGDDIVIVAIDSKSTAAIGRFPWTRTTHARLVDQLREWGASAVAFDVLFTEEEGIAEAKRLRQIASTLPAEPTANLTGTREAITTALAEVEVDRTFADVLERTYDSDAGLTVLSFNFVTKDDLAGAGQLGRVLTGEEEQIVLDIASYLSRDENSAIMRQDPPFLALGIRPVITRLAEWSAALGYANPRFDRDGALRREQTFVVYSADARIAFTDKRSVEDALLDPEARVQAYMPLSVAAVATHLRLTADQMKLDIANGQLVLEPPGQEPIVKAIDPFDGTAWIDFCGDTATFPTYPFVDVIENSLTDDKGQPLDGREVFAGKLVFVGATDPGLGDDFVTPYSARLPGVEKHANFAENLLNQRHLNTHEDYIAVVGLVTLAASVVTALLAANLGALWSAVMVVIGGFGWLVFTQMQFSNHGVIWNWVVPGLATVLGYAAVTSYRSAVERRAKKAMEERSKFIQSTFGRYLSDDVVAHIVDDPEGLKLGGERRRLTIMMSDLRGFTALCERSTPEVVVRLLNHYLGRMTEIIFKYQGTIDEIIGDAILGLFGAPISRPDDALRAVACAIEMQMAMDEVNEHLVAEGFPKVEMGIALNTGEVIVGNIGSERRSKYGVVGTNVNLTARIESYTVGGQVFISDATYQEAGPDNVHIGNTIQVKAKGLSEPLPAHEVLGVGAPHNLRMPEVVEDLVELTTPIEVEFGVLEGKHISDELIAGQLVRVSAIGADLQCGLDLEPLINIKLRIRDRDGTFLEEDLYGKVVDRPAAPDCCAVRFTSTPPEVMKKLKKMVVAAAV